MDLLNLTIAEACQRIGDGSLSAESLTKATLERIRAVDGELNAFLSVGDEAVLESARRIDADKKTGDQLPPLAGIPIAVKDLIVTNDYPTTAASRILGEYYPMYEATVVAALKRAGAVIVGKTNGDEFGLGTSGEYSAFGPTKNPLNRRRVAGGSSSGSAAAVAAGLCLGALGTDTGGSVRVPAAFTGLVGVKPTYGLVSRYGLIAAASSLDTIGVLARNVSDAARLFQTIVGYDPRDATSIRQPAPDYLDRIAQDKRRLRLGVPAEFFRGKMDRELLTKVRAAIELLQGLDCEIVEVSLPHIDLSLAAYHVINPAEVSSNLARYDGLRFGRSVLEKGQPKSLAQVYTASRDWGLGPDPKRRILLGTYALSRGYADRYYQKAQRIRTLIRQDFLSAWEKVDALVGPCTPEVAPALGAVRDPLSMYLADINVCAANLAGLPALSVPCGLAHNLPVGLQLIGKPLDEATLFVIAARYEKAASWPRPKLDLPE